MRMATVHHPAPVPPETQYTRSPGLNLWTSLPTDSTTPAPSMPGDGQSNQGTGVLSSGVVATWGVRQCGCAALRAGANVRLAETV